MKFSPIRTLFAAFAVTAVLAFSHPVCAQDHIVPPAALQQNLTDSAAARQQNEEQIQSLYAQPQVQRALRAAKIYPQQVTRAVSQLSDADLASLAARSAAAQKDFAAGNINDHDLLLILICIAALLLILVAVH